MLGRKAEDIIVRRYSGVLGGANQALSSLGDNFENREWYRLPPKSFAQRDLLGRELFFGSKPLNFGEGYGTGFGPSYFGNFGNAYGTGESRSYFGNYGIGYGVGESRKY